MKKENEIITINLDMTDILTVDTKNNIFVRGFLDFPSSDEEVVCLVPKQIYLKALNKFLSRKKDYYKSSGGDFCGVSWISSRNYKEYGTCSLMSSIHFDSPDSEGFINPKLIEVKSYLLNDLDVEMEHG
jgi:hypothetical protein